MNLLITGTSSGLGKALARQFLKNGATVYGISRRNDRELADFPQYHHLAQDLSLIDSLPGALLEFLSGVQTIDLAILNAGTFPLADNKGRVPVSEVTNLMQVNVWANKVIIDTLLKTIPNVYQVVAISCGKLISNIRQLHTFALSKSILNKWIRLYSREAPATHFSALAPGLVDTDLIDKLLDLPQEDDSPPVRELLAMQEKGLIFSPDYAANFLVEAMGSALHKDSGSYHDLSGMIAEQGREDNQRQAASRAMRTIHFS